MANTSHKNYGATLKSAAIAISSASVFISACAFNSWCHPARAYIIMGNFRGWCGDNIGAMKDCNEAVRLDPTDTFMYLGRAYEHHQQGDKKGAIDDCSRCIILNPKCVSAFRQRGSFRLVAREPQSAVGDFSRVIELSGQGYLDRARAWMELHDYDQAKADLDRAVVVDSDEVNSYF